MMRTRRFEEERDREGRQQHQDRRMWRERGQNHHKFYLKLNESELVTGWMVGGGTVRRYMMRRKCASGGG